MFYFFVEIFYVIIQGHFPILSLNGPCEFPRGAAGSAQREIELMSVSLSKPDGSVFGGGIGKSMIAATPIHVRIFFNIHACRIVRK